MPAIHYSPAVHPRVTACHASQPVTRGCCEPGAISPPMLTNSGLSSAGLGPPSYAPTAQGFMHPAQAALNRFHNPFREAAPQPSPAHTPALKPPRYSPVPQLPPASPLAAPQQLPAPSSSSSPALVRVLQGGQTMADRRSGPLSLIEKRESFRTRRREREAALRSIEDSLPRGSMDGDDGRAERLASTASLLPGKEVPDMGM